MLVYVIIIAIIVGVIASFTMIPFIISKRVHASIFSFFWERSITLEQQGWVKGTSYKGFPVKYRNGKKEQENYRQSTTVYKEKSVYRPGNPGPTDYEWVSEPVTEWKWETRTRYDYEVPRWQSGQTLLARGKSRDNVRWPEYVQGENVREKERKERYMVCFVAKDGKRYEKPVTEEVWAGFDANARYLLKITLLGKITKMHPIRKGSVKIHQPQT